MSAGIWNCIRGEKQVLLGGNEVSLTAKEYQLLEYFMRNQGQVLTMDNLLQAVWGWTESLYQRIRSV